MTFEQLPAVKYTEVRYSKADWVARITIDRHEACHAYSTPEFLWGSYAKSCPDWGARLIPSQFGFDETHSDQTARA